MVSRHVDLVESSFGIRNRWRSWWSTRLNPDQSSFHWLFSRKAAERPQSSKFASRKHRSFLDLDDTDGYATRDRAGQADYTEAICRKFRRACFHRAFLTGFPDWAPDWGFPYDARPCWFCSARRMLYKCRAETANLTRIGHYFWMRTFEQEPDPGFSASRWVLFGAVDRQRSMLTENAERGASPRIVLASADFSRAPSSQ